MAGAIKLTMTSPIPTKEQALEILAPISPEIFRAFEDGISKATTYFKNEGIEPRDPWAFAMIVKLHARENLRKSPNCSGVTFDRLSLCGISFHYKDWQIRLWRSADHANPKLPHPGRSDSKREYYVQPDLFPYRKTEPTELRFVILWDVNRDSKLEALWLVFPRNFNQKTGEITVYWDVELPNPIFAVQAPSETTPVPDLPYQIKEKKKKEG
ncbi:MAG: hypothetical protein ACHQIK_08785 [Candidatus Acidiferrales bacterium]